MDLSSALAAEGDRVVSRLAQVLEDLSPSDSPRLLAAMRYSLLGAGKRLRPVLCLWTVDAAGGTRTEAAERAACALEMVHTYSLIHDDLPAMDDDDLRRGQPSCHRRFDEATAILAGDALQTEAFRLLAGIDPPELARALIAELCEAIGVVGMAAGQQLDLDLSGQPPDAATMRLIHRLKTGCLLAASMAMGGLCAGLEARRVDLLREAGRSLGLAFQIVDDLLDLSPTELALGKTPGKDARQGKLSAVTVLGPESAREEAAEHVHEMKTSLAQAGLAREALLELGDFVLRRSV